MAAELRAVDTNVLIYAQVESTGRHETASDLLRVLAEGSAPWAIPWPCIYEFLRVVTHPRVFHPPMPTDTALRAIGSLLASPSLVLLAETPRHPEIMRHVFETSRASGNTIHDAHIVALCLEHGISELITGDRDFARFGELRIIDPFLE